MANNETDLEDFELAMEQNDEFARKLREADRIETEKKEAQRFANEQKQQAIEADKQSRQAAETEFRQNLKVDFLKANPFGNENDFERLYPTLRDERMIENLRKAK